MNFSYKKGKDGHIEYFEVGGKRLTPDEFYTLLIEKQLIEHN